MHVSSSSSPYTRLHTLPLNAVSLSPGFWRQKQTVNRQVSLRGGFQKLREYGNLDNLRLAATSQNGQYRGPVFMDSDIYKWLEAAAYDLGHSPDDLTPENSNEWEQSPPGNRINEEDEVEGKAV